MLTISPEKFAENLESASASSLADGALASAANIILSTAGNELSGVLNTARNCLSLLSILIIGRLCQNLILSIKISIMIILIFLFVLI